jgi:hypothetical protein
LRPTTRCAKWGFHNSRSGICFPSYERIADRAGCARSTVAEAIKVMEWAGILTWQNRITRIRERCSDLWGREGWRWRVIRTSNCYQFGDPKAQPASVPASKSDQRTGTPEQEVFKPASAPAIDPASALERALARLGGAVAAKNGIEEAATIG